MSDKVIQNDQENLHIDKKFQSSPIHSLYNHAAHCVKDRILQETQQSVQANTDLYSNPQRFNQTYFQLTNDSSQYDKIHNNTDPQKTNDKEMKQNLLEQITTSAFTTKDISYRIVNEILNTQDANRTFKTQASPIKVENKSTFTKVQIANANTFKLFKNPLEEKSVFHESEELKLLQEKIDEGKNQLQTKKEHLEENKKLYEIENNDIE